MQPATKPDPGLIFDAVLARKKFVPHPNKISSVLFYVAAIIIHDCFHTSHDEFAISETSSYLDLAPLYGSTAEQQEAMRTMNDGKIKADCFSDKRPLGFPPGVGMMLIMFNRFHNNVATNLAKIDEGGRFSMARAGQGGYKGMKSIHGEPLTDPTLRYDEALFQTARLVTTGLYVNIVLQDYVRTILGLNRVESLWNLDPRANPGKAMFGGKKIPQATGNQSSAEFNLVYRWHSCVSERDAEWTTEALKEFGGGEVLSGGKLLEALGKWNAKLSADPQERAFDDLKRKADGSFKDEDLLNIWSDSVEDVAGAFGAGHVPPILKSVEVLGMMQARAWNLASLNEFRDYFKLQPHKTFESINPDPHIAQQLERLYGHPDNVEIYPGIIVESAKKPMDPGSGLCANFTTSRAILSDAVALVRGDRFHTIDYTPMNLTNWGFQACSYDQNINFGGVLYKLVLNAFPQLPKNSIYAHYPLVNPSANKEILQGFKRDTLYSFDRPVANPAVDSLQRSIAFAGQTTKPKAQQMSFAEAVMTVPNWQDITTKFYQSTLTKAWKEKQYDLAGHQQIDIVADVLNAAHISFITSVLGLQLNPKKQDEKHETLLSVFGHLFDHTCSTNPTQPHGLSSAVRDWITWLADSVESAFHHAPADSKQGELGRAAFAKMAEKDIQAKDAAYHDILPTAALLMTMLSRWSAQTVEFILPEKPATGPATNGTAANGAATNGTTSKQQISNIAASTFAAELTSHTNETKLAAGIAKIVNKEVKGLLKGLKDLQRTPGPQGRIKLVRDEATGDVRYLNTEESLYVMYPGSMKIRWRA